MNHEISSLFEPASKIIALNNYRKICLWLDREAPRNNCERPNKIEVDEVKMFLYSMHIKLSSNECKIFTIVLY